MKRVLFVTVGTSAIFAEDLRDTTETGNLKKRVDRLRKPASSAEKDRLLGELRPDLIGSHIGTWEKLADRPPCTADYYLTSAELVSTMGLLRSRDELVKDFFARDRSDDKLVLLASNTPEGELAADVNAEVLHARLLGQQCKCDGAVKNCERISVKAVRGLESMSGFGKVQEGLLETVTPFKGAQAGFNITGGYKGLIPYVTWLTLGVFEGAPLYYQHESMPGLTKLTLEPAKAEGRIGGPVAHAATRLREETIVFIPIGWLPTK